MKRGIHRRYRQNPRILSFAEVVVPDVCEESGRCPGEDATRAVGTIAGMSIFGPARHEHMGYACS